MDAGFRSELAGPLAFNGTTAIGWIDDGGRAISFFVSDAPMRCDKIDQNSAESAHGVLIGRIEKHAPIGAGHFPLSAFGPNASRGTLAGVNRRTTINEAFNLFTPTTGEIVVTEVTRSSVGVQIDLAFEDAGRLTGAFKVLLCPQVAEVTLPAP